MAELRTPNARKDEPPLPGPSKKLIAQVVVFVGVRILGIGCLKGTGTESLPRIRTYPPDGSGSRDRTSILFPLICGTCLNPWEGRTYWIAPSTVHASNAKRECLRWHVAGKDVPPLPGPSKKLIAQVVVFVGVRILGIGRGGFCPAQLASNSRKLLS